MTLLSQVLIGHVNVMSIQTSTILGDFHVDICIKFQGSNMDTDDSSSTCSTIDGYILDNLLNDVEFESIQDKIRSPKNKTEVKKSNFWSDVYPSLSDIFYKQRYRISRNSMDYLIENYFDLSSIKSFENWRIGVVATMDYLASKCRIMDLVLRYGLAQGLMFKLTECVINVFGSKLLSDYCNWPNEQERRVNASLFKQKFKLPLCIGAIDGTLININGMGLGKADLTSRKSSYALNLLLVCDYYGSIIYYVNGAAASLGDSVLYDASLLAIQKEERFYNAVNPLDNYYLISDKGIPCDNYIVTPYQDDNHLSVQKHRFNYFVQRARAIIERLNGMLKQRSQILSGGMTARSLKKAEEIILACLAVHNYSIKSNNLHMYANDDTQAVVTENLFANAYEYNESDLDDYSDTRDKLYNYINNLDFY